MDSLLHEGRQAPCPLPASNVVLLRAPPVTGALVLAERALQ